MFKTLKIVIEATADALKSAVASILRRIYIWRERRDFLHARALQHGQYY